jgi:hypothetical protein
MSDMKTVVDNGVMGEADRDAVLIAFMEAGANAPLGEWIGRYPAHSADLARAAAARWAGEPVGVPALSGDALATAHIRTLGREAFAALRPAPRLTSLLETARARGIGPQTVAARLSVPYGLFIKLHRRLIAPDTIPATLIRNLAESLERSVDDIAAYLRQPPTLALGASYRADSAPKTGAQESFADALDADPEATDAQRAAFRDAGA